MLKFENPSNGRYYYIWIEKDLFNDEVLVVLRGGSRSGARVLRTILCNGSCTTRTQMDKMAKQRLKRGYVLIQ